MVNKNWKYFGAFYETDDEKPDTIWMSLFPFGNPSPDPIYSSKTPKNYYFLSMWETEKRSSLKKV
jgi:hypothetical protein